MVESGYKEKKIIEGFAVFEILLNIEKGKKKKSIKRNVK